MAYSDYGGYAYRNGVRVEERSDATITPEGDTFGTPGSWPGFAMLAAGVDMEEVKKRTEWPNGHAVIGDGPVYVALYKQSYTPVYRAFEKVDTDALIRAKYPEAVKRSQYSDSDYVDDDYFRDNNIPIEIEVEGCKITIRYTYEDNYYQYVKLEQPDGNVWHGWSGYGVGAGLEDCGYGFSTDEREDMLWELFGKGEVL